MILKASQPKSIRIRELITISSLSLFKESYYKVKQKWLV
nr:MAG TPA: hypothetical protein [Caudoviricetes sp.]